MLGNASRWLNRVFGGRTGESLCVRWSRARGSYCLPCRIVGLLLRNPDHCFEQFIHELKEKRK